MKYKPSRDIPQAVRELKDVSPSKIVKWILNKRNEERTPESVTMWFKDNGEVFEQLKKEIVGGLPTEKQTVDETIFSNSNFENLASVKEWTSFLRGVRRIKEVTIKDLVSHLKLVCCGKIGNFDLVSEGKWTLKHPDRLSYEDGITILSLLKEKGIDLYAYSKTLKSFLVLKGVTEGARLMVGSPRSKGKYKDLFVERDALDKILSDVRALHGNEAYLIDMIMFRHACRINAVLNSKIEDLHERDLTTYEKGLERKYGERGKPRTVRLEQDLFELLKTVIGERQTGRIFSLSDNNMAKINLKAITKFAPQALARYPNLYPNHFWRHMFAQQMLRLTSWNYAIVAYLGNWTPQALEESYGGADKEQLRQWSEKYHLDIEVKT